MALDGYIMQTLNRLEDKLDKQNKLLQDHMNQEEQRFSEIEQKVVKLEQDAKWYSRIASGVGALAAIFVSWFVGIRQS